MPITNPRSRFETAGYDISFKYRQNDDADVTTTNHMIRMDKTYLIIMVSLYFILTAVVG